MKLLLTTLALSVLTFVTVAQEDKLKVLQDLEMSDTTKYIIVDTTKTNADTKTLTGVGGKDTTKIRIGKREIVIVENGSTTSIEIPETGDKHTFDRDKDKNFTYKRKARFKGHWAGFEWGFNGFMDADQSINMQGDLKYLELKQGRSWNLNLNFMQYSLGFGTDKIGLVTGLGLEFNDYHFRNSTSIKVEDGVTVVNNSYALDPNKIVTKSKLSTTYFTAPLLLEFQIPTSYKHRIFFSAGVVGGVKIGSKTKVVYEGTNKGKDKVRDDYNLSPFRYGVTARVGYRKLSLFATYYPVQLFEENKGDEIYPFAIGLRLLSF